MDNKKTKNGFKIAILAAMPFPTSQGSQVFIGSLVYALKQAGHEITFLTYPFADGRLTEPSTRPQNPKATSQPLASGGRGAKVAKMAGDLAGQVSRLASTISPKLLRSGPSVAKVEQDILLFKNSLSELRAKRPDLLYVHNYEALCMGIPMSRLLGIPLLYHAHNVMSAELPSYFTFLSTKLLALAGGKALDFLPAMADKILFFSQEQAELLDGHFISQDHLAIIPPGLLAKEPSDLFWQKSAPETLPELPKEPYFLYTGNCDNYQNLPLLQAAYKKFKEKGTGHLLLCTSSKPAANILATPGIKYLPMSSPRLLTILLKKATALIVPRQMAFGFPIKVLQAMRAGLPVIGLEKTLGQLILPHEALLTDDTPEAMAAAMHKIARYAALRERLSHQSILTFNERFCLEKQVKEYTRLFSHLLAKKK